jgi:hypothetical protein
MRRALWVEEVADMESLRLADGWKVRLFLVVAVLLLAPPGFGQGDRGTITGLVTDSSHAAIPDVEIVATHVATNVQTTTRSGPTGAYNLLRLPVGTYTLVARKEGFRAYQQTEIPVRVGETVRLDITLEVGQLTEQVTVVGAAPLIQSESAEVGLVLTSSQFTELPLTLGGGIRNPSSFIFLQPGVSQTGTWEKHIIYVCIKNAMINAKKGEVPTA